MASFLEGSLQRAIAQGFKGRLLKGTLTRSSGSGLDEFGDVVPGNSTTYTFEGFVDQFSAFVRAQAGIPDTDAKITIIAGSLKPFVNPRQDDHLTLRGDTYNVVRLINQDPALATFELQATKLDG